jgi:hypothetical protein
MFPRIVYGIFLFLLAVALMFVINFIFQLLCAKVLLAYFPS